MVESWQQWEGRIVNGEFPLQQYLGGSAESAVYLTEVQGTRAAIKFIEAEAPEAKAQAAQWKLAARLSHPNLVKILQTGLWHADDEHDLLFAVMEYCDESLEGVLRQRSLTPTETREMLAPALDALSYLHGQNLVHGEIKPANILASGDELKLSSDGIRRMGDVDGLGGSGYDGPENSVGTTGIGGDVRSLGLTLLQSLKDRSQERGSNDDPKSADGLPVPFGAIVKGCLAQDPAQRLSIADIRKLLNDRDVTRKQEAKPVPMAETTAAKTTAVDIPAAPTKASIAPDPRSVPPVRSKSDSSAIPIVAGVGSQRKTSHDVPAVGVKRVPVLIGGVILAVLVIVGGLRWLRPSSESSQPNRAARQDAVTSSPVTKAPVARDNAPVIVAKPVTPKSSDGAVAHQVMPEVSKQARSSINGTVKVRVGLVVDAQGKVSRTSLAGAGPSKYFARQAQEAARQWTFTPPVQDGKPQASAWTVIFEFRRSGTKATARPTHSA